MRTVFVSTLLIFISVGCGRLDELTGSSSDSGEQTDFRGDASTNDSSFAGTYIFESMEVMGNAGTIFLYVLEGQCVIRLGAANADGWRSYSNNSNCRIGNRTYNSLVVETAVSRVQLNSLGAVINIDKSQTQTTTALPKDVDVIESSITFTYSGMVAKYTIEQNGERIYQSHVYRKE